MGKRKGRSVRKNKQVAAEDEAEEVSRAPHSFVVHRGKTGKFVQDLAADFRQVMEPYTASNIKVRPRNVIKDFVHVAGLLKVSHLAMFTKTSMGPYLKLARFPRGPTLTFRIQSYTLGRDVRSSLKRQVTYAKQYANHALLIMNNFSSGENDRSMQLMESMFQNMFPSINPSSVKVNSIRRCVLLNYNKDDNTIDFRHYTIKVVPVGLNRGVKKIVTSKVPNLGRLADMSEFLSGKGVVSESEGEDDEASKVTVPQGLSSRGLEGGQQSSVRLVELGPRMRLQLVKIEEGLLDGEVLHHEFVEKTEEEKKIIKEKREKKKREKEKRKRDQDKNVKKKEKDKVDNKQKSLEGMKSREDKEKAKEEKEKTWQGEKIKEYKKQQAELGEPIEADINEPSDDDDEAWYEKEVGEKPDKELFDGPSSSKSFDGGKRFKNKKRESGPKKSSRNNKWDEDRDDKKNKKKTKGKLKVFNSDGVGPNFKKGSAGGKVGPKYKKGGSASGKGGLRGVKAGKIKKKKH